MMTFANKHLGKFERVFYIGDHGKCCWRNDAAYRMRNGNAALFGPFVAAPKIINKHSPVLRIDT